MKKYSLIISFSFFILLFSIAQLLIEDKKFSDLENKVLSKKPNITLNKVFKGEYSKEFESYYNDQFPFRNGFISLKSLSESAFGKIENNGVIFGDDDYMFLKFFSADEGKINKNIESINAFIDKNSLDTTLVIPPSSFEIYKEELNKFTPEIWGREVISNIYNKTNSNNIDLITPFNHNKDLNLYYKTDHHWTIDGAYLAYLEYCKSKGLTPMPLDDFNRVEVKNFYGTLYSKSKKFNTKGEVLSYYDIPIEYMEIDGEKKENLYDLSLKEKRDKYGLFIYGNNNITKIKSSLTQNGKKLLVIKDSYANSFVPFLTFNYEEIHIIDLRMFNGKISEYIEKENLKEALILYNVINFCEDINFVKLKG